MNDFSALSLEQSEEAQRLQEQMNAATNRREFKRLMELKRTLQFTRVVEFLRGLGVKARMTDSYWELTRHLKKGRPAYISTNVTTQIMARPHEIRWNDSIPMLDDDTADGTIPMPTWVPSSTGFNAVMAFSILPRASGLTGMLLGKQVVILDLKGRSLNVWPTGLLRASRTSRFILIGE